MLWYISAATISSRFIWFQVVNSVSTKKNSSQSVSYFSWGITQPPALSRSKPGWPGDHPQMLVVPRCCALGSRYLQRLLARWPICLVAYFLPFVYVCCLMYLFKHKTLKKAIAISHFVNIFIIFPKNYHKHKPFPALQTFTLASRLWYK